ncbi:MAG: hypothetical protein Ta2A_26430 [Treponemataceae bacterium]|nr:MAG: hypothetical protein Ta2A_26430 [Treponemataceae bacterium]
MGIIYKYGNADINNLSILINTELSLFKDLCKCVLS